MTEGPQHLRPSAVARRMLEQHERLGSKLDELSRAGRELRAGGPLALERVLGLARGLHDELLAHIVLEGRLLVPALRDIDAWGKVRADKLLERLRIRRRELKDLRESCGQLRTGLLGGVIRRFVAGRLADMAHAERHVFHENVLRDDVLGVDVSCG